MNNYEKIETDYRDHVWILYQSYGSPWGKIWEDDGFFSAH